MANLPNNNQALKETNFSLTHQAYTPGKPSSVPLEDKVTNHPRTPHFPVQSHSALTPLSQLSSIHSPRHGDLPHYHNHNASHSGVLENSAHVYPAQQENSTTTEVCAHDTTQSPQTEKPPSRKEPDKKDPITFEISAIETQMRHFVCLKQQYNADKTALKDVEDRIQELENDKSELEESARGFRQSVRWYLDTKNTRVSAIKQLVARISELTNSLANTA